MPTEFSSSLSHDGDSTRFNLVDEAARRQFEAAWGRGKPEPIERLLPAADSDHYLATLEELVHIDLEFAWKTRSDNDTCAGAAGPPLVEDYVQRFGQLSDPTILQRLLQQEYRVRQRYGDHPTLDDYRRRFPDVLSSLSDGETWRGAGAAPRAAPPDLPGYEILGELGHGGMGVVYKARHCALNRVVAVKMMREGPGDQAEVEARFRAEAEAVARLRHPDIVQVYEIGAHDGCPYFTLEFVPGGSLDRLLDGAPQPPQPAARLVAQLARAVHYAHQQGVIHRDLKPANVLLAKLDPKSEVRSQRSEVGQEAAASSLTSDPCPLTSVSPKVTDFGLAKLLESPGQTKTGEMLGTPCYMAPEQARGDHNRVGPATDVYAVGAILYECLTGRPPFRGVNSWDTVSQVMSEEPVPPRQLQPTVPADLETVCLKCLAKEPARRYDTAAALADDLERFLRDEPIRARPAGRAERLVRWCRRNPVVAGLSAAFGAVVAASLVGLTALWLRAESSATEARHQRDRADVNFRKARDAVDQMLARVGFDKLYGVPRMDQVRRDLLEEALHFYQGFLTEQADDPSVRSQTGRMYRQAGAICFLLGQHRQAEDYFRAGVTLLEPLIQETPDDAAPRLELMYCHGLLGDLECLVGRLPEAEQSFRRQIRLYRKSGPDAQITDLRGSFASGLMNQGYVLQQTGRTDAAAESFQEAIDILTPFAPTSPVNQHDLGIAKRSLGVLLEGIGEVENGEGLIRESLRLHGQLVTQAPDFPLYREGVALDFSRLGTLLRSAGRYDEAEDAYQRALDLQRKLAADYPGILGYRADLAETQIQRCALLIRAGKPWDAELVRAHRDAIALYSGLAGDFPAIPHYRSHLGAAEQSLGTILRDTGQPAEAERMLRTSVARYERLATDLPTMPQYRERIAETLDRLGNLLRDIDRPADAERVLRQAVAVQEKLVADFPDVPSYRRNLADYQNNLRTVLTDNGQPITPEMIQAHRDAVAFFQKLTTGPAANVGDRERLAISRTNLGNVLQTTGQLREAEAEFRQAVTLFEALSTDAPTVAGYRFGLAVANGSLSELLWFTDRLTPALEVQRQALVGYERLAAEYPTLPEYRRRVGGAYYMLAVYERNLGHAADAEVLHAKALAVREKLVADYPDVPAHRLALAKSHISRGIVLVSQGRYAEAEQGYRWAIDLYEKRLAGTPGVPEYLSLLAGTLDNYAESLLARGEPAEAKKYIEQAVVHEQAALQANPRSPQYLRFMGSHYAVLAEAQIRLGEHAGAVQAALNLARLFPESGPKAREAAGLIAECIPLAEKDAHLSETERVATAQTYAGQALRLLREAVQKGYKDAANLRNDARLAPLRAHEDFRRLLEQLEKRSPS